MSLSVRLFGSFDVRIDDVPLRRFHSRKEEWLFALLVLNQVGDVSRDWLADSLWPDSEQSSARAFLRQSLYFLRQALGVEAHRLRSIGPHSIRLDLANVDVDVLTFDEWVMQAETAKLEAACALYRGPLLEGCSEEWVITERNIREQRYIETLSRLAEAAGQLGRHVDAVKHLSILVRIDPYRESAHRDLMRALAHQREFGALTVAYRALRLRLRQDLNASPAPETLELYEHLRSRIHSEQSSVLVTSSIRNVVGAQSPESSKPVRKHVPRPLTSLIGRDALISDLERELMSARLLTLTGAGGVGKTRVAIGLAERFSGPVWFVELASVPKSGDVIRSVAAVMELKDSATDDAVESVAEQVGTKVGLLILDNCEHLIPSCLNAVKALVHACEGLRIALTSRQPLGMAGEVIRMVPPLSSPPAVGRQSGQELVHVKNRSIPDAVRLFCDRARSVSPTFELTDVVGDICRSLDGIPLAIELAAARTRLLSPAQIRDRLSDRFGLLNNGLRVSMPHHQTLRSLIDWSYDLLSEAECCLFRRLSAFRGGWTIEEAEVICSLSRVPLEKRKSQFCLSDSAVLDLMSSLVEKSLVVVDPQRAEPRYYLLETVREYSISRLSDSDEQEVLNIAHRDYFFDTILAHSSALRNSGKKEVVYWFQAEVENIRTALEQSLVPGVDSKMALRFCASLNSFWIYRGYFREGLDWCERALDRPEAQEPTIERGLAMFTAGNLWWISGDLDRAEQMHRQALKLRREINDLTGIANSLDKLGVILARSGRTVEAEQCLEEALVRARQVDDVPTLANVLNDFGCVAESQGRLALARQLWEGALAVRRRHGGHNGVALALINLAHLACRETDYITSRRMTMEAMELMRGLGDLGGVAMCLHNLGSVATRQGCLEESRTYQCEALKIWQDMQALEGILMAIEAFVELEAAHARLAESQISLHVQRAITLLAASSRLREINGVPVRPEYADELTELSGRITARAIPEEIELWVSHGSTLQRDAMVLLALSTVGS